MRSILYHSRQSFFIGIFFLSSSILNGQIPDASCGKLTHIENFPSNFVKSRNVDIWLPDGYNEKTKYAVIYMHDGQMLFDSTTNWNHQEWGVDETAGKLIAENKIRVCIVVGIWNLGAERHSEYCPQKPYNSLSEGYRDTLLTMVRTNGNTQIFNGDIHSDNYLKFIVKELKPYIDSAYSTMDDQENTFIAGSSMGGLISLYAICEYPDIFGGAACLSTHWTVIYTDENNPVPDTIIKYVEKNLPPPVNHKIYFDYGTETLDTLYQPYQEQVDKIMEQKGYTSNNWKTMRFPGENHSEKAWRRRLDIPLIFLLQ